MTPVAAPADKRFRRSRVSPTGKRRWRPSWWTVARGAAVCAVLVVGAYRTLSFVRGSEALTVTRITVQGHQRMSRGEVLALLEGLPGTSMVTTDLEGWRRKLLASPWVEDAAIRRTFPGTVAVAISERRPMGIGRLRGSLYLVDDTGEVIDEFGPNYADLDLPIIDGLAAGQPGTDVDEARAALAGRLMTDLQRWPGLSAQISQIDVTDVRNAVVLLKDDTALVRVGDERFSERLQSYLDLMPALRKRIPEIDYVDLRFDERVYVKPHERGSRGLRLPARGTSRSRGSSGG